MERCVGDRQSIWIHGKYQEIFLLFRRQPFCSPELEVVVAVTLLCWDCTLRWFAGSGWSLKNFWSDWSLENFNADCVWHWLGSPESGIQLQRGIGIGSEGGHYRMIDRPFMVRGIQLTVAGATVNDPLNFRYRVMLCRPTEPHWRWPVGVFANVQETE